MYVRRTIILSLLQNVDTLRAAQLGYLTLLCLMVYKMSRCRRQLNLFVGLGPILVLVSAYIPYMIQSDRQTTITPNFEL